MKICFYGESQIIKLELLERVFRESGFEIVREEEAEAIFSFDRDYLVPGKDMVYPEEFYFRYLKSGNKTEIKEEEEKFDKEKLTYSIDEALMFPFVKILYRSQFLDKLYSLNYITSIFFKRDKLSQLKIEKLSEGYIEDFWKENSKFKDFNIVDDKISLLYRLSLYILSICDSLNGEDIKRLDEKTDEVHEERIVKEKKEYEEKYGSDEDYEYYEKIYISIRHSMKYFELLYLRNKKTKEESFEALERLFSLKDKECFLKFLSKYSGELINSIYLNFIPKETKTQGFMKIIHYYAEIENKKYKRKAKKYLKNIKNTLDKFMYLDFMNKRQFLKYINSKDYYIREKSPKKLKWNVEIREILEEKKLKLDYLFERENKKSCIDKLLKRKKPRFVK